MTAGAAEVAFAMESGVGSDGYGDLPDTPTWYQPGVDVEVDGPTLDNQLVRQRQPDSPKSARSREGNLLGSVSVTFTLTDDNWHELVFTENGNTALPDSGSDEWPSATWYFSADVPGINEERFCAGAFVTDVSIEYQQGEDVRVSLTMNYQTEKDLTTPAGISQPEEADAFMWHGLTPERGNTEIAEMQSMTISLSNLSRGRRDQSRLFTRAVAGAFELSFNTDAIFAEDDTLELAYGSSAATTPADTIDQTDFTAAFVNAGGDEHEFSLDGAQPTNYSWSQLVGEEDLTEPTEFHVADVGVTVT